MKGNHTKSRQHRILRAMNSYHAIEHLEFTPSALVREASEGMGTLLGFYENSPVERVFVSEGGIVVSSGEVTVRIRFEDIAAATVEGEDKHAAEFIEVREKTGRRYRVPIRHGNGPYRDVWEFWRFWDRTYKEVQRRALPSCALEDASVKQHTHEK